MVAGLVALPAPLRSILVSLHLLHLLHLSASHIFHLSATIGEPHIAVGCSLSLMNPVSGADPFVEVQAGDIVSIGKEPKMFMIKHFTLYPSKAQAIGHTP